MRIALTAALVAIVGALSFSAAWWLRAPPGPRRAQVTEIIPEDDDPNYFRMESTDRYFERLGDGAECMAFDNNGVRTTICLPSE